MEESHKEEPIAKVDSYHHPRHLEKQQSSSKGCKWYQNYYGTRKLTIMVAHEGLKAMQGNTRVAQ